MKFISGKKLSMTQIWSGDKVVGVTPVQAGPCVITQVKTETKDGYSALQLAFGQRQAKNIKKPQRGHVKSLGINPAHLREFRTTEAGSFQVGDVITVGAFQAGDLISVTATSKGKGFQGVVKRHHFAGFRKTHGNKDQERMGGSVGPKGPAHVFKGTRMGGRMGGERVTTSNLEVVQVDEAANIIYIKGSVPGAINSLVLINGTGELRVNLQPTPAVSEKEKPASEETETGEEKAEEIKEEAAEETKEETKVEEEPKPEGEKQPENEQ